MLLSITDMINFKLIDETLCYKLLDLLVDSVMNYKNSDEYIRKLCLNCHLTPISGTDLYKEFSERFDFYSYSLDDYIEIDVFKDGLRRLYLDFSLFNTLSYRSDLLELLSRCVLEPLLFFECNTDFIYRYKSILLAGIKYWHVFCLYNGKEDFVLDTSILLNDSIYITEKVVKDIKNVENDIEISAMTVRNLFAQFKVLKKFGFRYSTITVTCSNSFSNELLLETLVKKLLIEDLPTYDELRICMELSSFMYLFTLQFEITKDVIKTFKDLNVYVEITNVPDVTKENIESFNAAYDGIFRIVM